MNHDTPNNIHTSIKVLVISFLFIFFLFIWGGNKGFDMWDEGFLWYGAQRVMLGEVPIRDFMSYDPGRYYWCAVLLSMIGNNGIMSLRAAAVIFQALGLFTGVLLIAQSAKTQNKDNVIFWIVSTVILAVWMFPYFKAFDFSSSIFLIGILTFLVRDPIPKRYFIAGIGVGLIAVFGRNHGVYGAVGSLGVMVWLNIKRSSGPGFLKGFILWSAGVALGFFPIIFMMLVIPGFTFAFWESIRFLLAAILPLPVPWPWTVNFAVTSNALHILHFSKALYILRGVLIGLFFVGTLVFGALAILWVVRQKLRAQPVPPVLVAAAFLAFPYAHYAFSRADATHLALGIFPLLVGCLVLLSVADNKIKWPLTLGLCAASFFSPHADWRCFVSKQCVNVEISGNNLQVNPGTASDIALLRQLAKQYAPNGRSFVATPFWPGAYALLERKSPMWEIYALTPQSKSFQNKEIERIKTAKPGFVIILDFPLDGRDELRFKNTHPLIYKYILDNFDRIQSSLNPAYQLYRAK